MTRNGDSDFLSIFAFPIETLDSSSKIFAENSCKTSAEQNLCYAEAQPNLAHFQENAEIAQLVEHQLPKLRVASSNLVFRSFRSLHPKDAATVCL